MDELIKHLLNKFSNDASVIKNTFLGFLGLSIVLFFGSIYTLYQYPLVQDYAAVLLSESVFVGLIALLLKLLILAGDDKIEEFEKQSTGNIVIVPISLYDDIEYIRNKQVYFCQKDRYFKPTVKYIGFYHLGRVIGYWELLKINDSGHDKLKAVKDYWSVGGKYGILKDYDVYDLHDVKGKNNLIKVWDRPVVRKQQYISIEDFNKLPEGSFGI